MKNTNNIIRIDFYDKKQRKPVTIFVKLSRPTICGRFIKVSEQRGLTITRKIEEKYGYKYLVANGYYDAVSGWQCVTLCAAESTFNNDIDKLTQALDVSIGIRNIYGKVKYSDYLKQKEDAIASGKFVLA